MNRIDLHVHSSFSDGKMTPAEILYYASESGIRLISITDHDSIECQAEALEIAEKHNIGYVCGLEFSVMFSHPEYLDGESIPLDFLAYRFDIKNKKLNEKLFELRSLRKKRASLILKKVNSELASEGLDELTEKELDTIEKASGGTIGRPHIADYMIQKGIVKTRQDAFDRYLVKCYVPKTVIYLEEVSSLVRDASGVLVLAHPNHPRGTSLIKFNADIHKQQHIIDEIMLPFIDGIECWHSTHDLKTARSYTEFARSRALMITGGSDCHQQPLIMGSVDVPLFVGKQFGFDLNCDN